MTGKLTATPEVLDVTRGGRRIRIRTYQDLLEAPDDVAVALLYLKPVKYRTVSIVTQAGVRYEIENVTPRPGDGLGKVFSLYGRVVAQSSSDTPLWVRVKTDFSGEQPPEVKFYTTPNVRWRD